MQTDDFYSTAHLFVAAVRVWEYQNSTPPSVEDICHILSFSLERSNFICKQLQDLGIVEAIEGAYGRRLYIKDNLKIEDIPKGEKGSKLEEELSKFKKISHKNIHVSFLKKLSFIDYSFHFFREGPC